MKDIKEYYTTIENEEQTDTLITFLKVKTHHMLMNELQNYYTRVENTQQGLELQAIARAYFGECKVRHSLCFCDAWEYCFYTKRDNLWDIYMEDIEVRNKRIFLPYDQFLIILKNKESVYEIY